MTANAISWPTTQSSTDISAVPVFAHVVEEEGLTRAYVLGEPVTALCGYTWVPCRDPDRYPLCPDCAELLTP